MTTKFTSKKALCDYLQPSRERTDPQAPERDADLGQLDVTLRGQSELLWTAHDLKGTLGFTQLAHALLIESGVSIPALLEDFSTSIFPWFPILDLGELADYMHSLQELRVPRTSPHAPLLLLAVHLVITHPLSHVSHPRHDRVYRTLQLASSTQRVEVSGLEDELVQLQALLSLHEHRQGLNQQAHSTLSSAVAMSTLLDNDVGIEDEKFLPLKLALMTLDR